MTFMNDFVDREFSSMRTFLQQISVSSIRQFILLIFSQKEAKIAEEAFGVNTELPISVISDGR